MLRRSAEQYRAPHSFYSIYMKIAVISYLNATPYVDGLRRAFAAHEAELLLLPPAECAKALYAGECDAALLPVGALGESQNIRLLPNYCIGANGAVESVFILSQQPIETLDTLLLDPESRSSNRLAEVLSRHYWHTEPRLQPTKTLDYVRQINGSTGGVVIGDKAIKYRKDFAYAYDLPEAWRQLTGLPFVFATWAIRPDSFPADQYTRFCQALNEGIEQAAGSAIRWADTYNVSEPFALHYLLQCLDFRFDDAKHRSMRLYRQFLEGIA